MSPEVERELIAAFNDGWCVTLRRLLRRRLSGCERIGRMPPTLSARFSKRKFHRRSPCRRSPATSSPAVCRKRDLERLTVTTLTPSAAASSCTVIPRGSE
jgi:hypothetical protein